MSVAVLFLSFLVFLFVGFPVAYCLGISSLLYFLLENMPLVTFAQRFFSGLDSFTLLCIPGFMLAGNLMNTGGITYQIVRFCDKVIGHIRGGLGLANIGASMIFAGVSGTAAADAASLGGILIPAMVKDGYDADYSVAVTAASSCIGPIIPPSVPMIMAGTLTGISVSKMFVAGVIPGVLMGLGMMVVAWVISVKRNYPKNERRATFREIISSGREAFWALLMVVIILAGILTGIVTPTEASIIAVLYALFIGFVLPLVKTHIIACLIAVGGIICSVFQRIYFADILPVANFLQIIRLTSSPLGAILPGGIIFLSAIIVMSIIVAILGLIRTLFYKNGTILFIISGGFCFITFGYVNFSLRNLINFNGWIMQEVAWWGVIYCIAALFCVLQDSSTSAYKLTIKSALAVIRDSMVGAAGIMVLVGFANVFAYVLTKEQIPTMIANWILSITRNKFVILLIINIFLLFVGCFMETIAALTILFPVLLPVVTSIGVSPIQFGVMCVLNLVIGLTTPPVGVCLFITT